MRILTRETGHATGMYMVSARDVAVQVLSPERAAS
jgi:hypothetical protein